MSAIPAIEPAIQGLVGLAYKDPAIMRRQIDAARCERPGGLSRFVKLLWPIVEPTTRYLDNWHIDAICEHLEAVSRGAITRLLINISPGAAKSLLVNVFWPAYEWGPLNRPSERYICTSYSQQLTIRDNVRFRNVIISDIYQSLWKDRFQPSKDQFSLVQVGNDRTGFKLATSVSGIGTGARGTRILLDDPNSVQESESDVVRESTNRYVLEVVPTRLSDPRKDAIVIIQQRVHAADVSGTVLDRNLGYEHLVIPMKYDSRRRYYTSIGWTDPRGIDKEGYEIDNDGALMWPELYPEIVVERLESALGRVASAGQLQQTPVPRGGAIFELDMWQSWPPPDSPEESWISPDKKILFPPMEYIVAAVDTAYTEKKENDFSAMVVMGVFRSADTRMAVPQLQRGEEGDPIEFLRVTHDNRPKVLMMFGWQKRLPLHGPPEHRPVGVSDAEWHGPLWRAERQHTWGLVEWVHDTCRRYKVDHLIIESQAAGHSLNQELRRLHSDGDWGVELVSAGAGSRSRGSQDKVARANSVQHLFANKIIYAPVYPDTGLMPQWCDTIVNQMALFPRSQHDDLTDAAIYCVRHLRDAGILVRGDEFDADAVSQLSPPGNRKALYEV